MPPVVARSLAAAFAAAFLVARPAAGQLPPYTPPVSAPRGTPPQPSRAVSASPLLILLGSYAGDYEQRAGEHLTWGVGAQYDGKDSILRGGSSGYDLDVSAKLRYYPTSPALDGYSIGLVAGGTRYQRSRTGSSDGGGFPIGGDQRTHAVPTVGFTFDYNRLYGDEKRFLLGTGIGVKRRFVRRDDGFDRVTEVRPTFRLAFGYAW